MSFATSGIDEHSRLTSVFQAMHLSRLGVALGVVVVVLLVAVVAVYAWPLGSDHLRTAPTATLDFADSQARAQAAVQADETDPSVRPECRTQSLIHPQRTAKAVLMLHGYTDCPKQYTELAKLFYDRGYNVFVPRAPRHGVTDLNAHTKLQADELIDYANSSLITVSGLGDEVGVIGVSGGAVLGTWLAEYRPDVVQRLLVLSPFFTPASSQAPRFAVKPLIVLYGNRLLPDHRTSNGFSFAALSQYLRIARNYKSDPVNAELKSVAVVTSAGDPFIDRGDAVRIPSRFATRNGLTAASFEIPASFGIGHDTVETAQLGTHAAELDARYLALYEGTAVPAA
jgi:alpha-beta hydrolase superfamily lysophospholipase